MKLRKLTTPVAVPLTAGGFASLMIVYGSIAAPLASAGDEAERTAEIRRRAVENPRQAREQHRAAADDHRLAPAKSIGHAARAAGSR